MLKIEPKWIPYKERADSHLAEQIIETWRLDPLIAPYSSRRPVLWCIREFLDHALPFPGDVAEFGVYKGVSAKLMASRMAGSGKALHLLDTFRGMPPVDPRRDNYWMAGDFSDTSVELVRDFLKGYDFVRIHEGLFENSVRGVGSKQFCFVHIDADIYESVKFATEYAYPKMTKGGILVYDDYGDLISKGAKAAVDEFYKDKEKEKVIYLPTKQAVVIKTSS